MAARGGEGRGGDEVQRRHQPAQEHHQHEQDGEQHRRDHPPQIGDGVLDRLLRQRRVAREARTRLRQPCPGEQRVDPAAQRVESPDRDAAQRIGRERDRVASRVAVLGQQRAQLALRGVERRAEDLGDAKSSPATAPPICATVPRSCPPPTAPAPARAWRRST